MKKTLLEAYQNKLRLAEGVYKKTHDGREMSYNTKVATAVMLNNVNKALTESFENSIGTQRADMGDYKRFCLAITNVVFPSLIAEDLVIVKPMTSSAGSIAYCKYTYGSNKGGIKQGQEIANPWGIAARTEDNSRYTGAPVVEAVEKAGDVVLAWTPVDGKVKFLADGGSEWTELEVKDGKVTVTGKGKIAYVYDNVKIPQNDLPIVNMRMENIALVAKARRVAVYYSQIAAFQATQDYGFDMGKELAQKACAELSFEINEEIIHFLAEMGRKNEVENAVFNKELPYGVSKRDHYESFIECIEEAKVAVYNKTQKFMPSYMLAASDVLPILAFVPGFKASSLTNVAGPFMAGTLNGLKVFVSPSLTSGEWFLGVNGDDLTTSAAVYAPYMPIIPTQLVGYADGGMSQGFSTMYDLKALNEQLVVGGKIVKETRVVTTTQA